MRQQAPRESAHPAGEEALRLFVSIAPGENARRQRCTSALLPCAHRSSHGSARVQTQPWHRVCVHTTPQADLGDPRWFVPCGCAPESVANRSLTDIVSATRALGQQYAPRLQGRGVAGPFLKKSASQSNLNK